MPKGNEEPCLACGARAVVLTDEPMPDNTNNDDGGPAFPMPETNNFGISKRDWFAGQALAGLCATLREGELCGDCGGNFEKSLALSVKHFSLAAYAYADGMITARK